MLQPIRNERGHFIVAHREGGVVPVELSNQIWLSEKETNLAIIKYLAEKKETTKPTTKE